jgi:hypothetical protein
MDILYKYNNGNTIVTMYKDGTKVREYDDNVTPKPIFPESIDIKITDYCDMGCKYCHESSTTKGKHGDLDKLLEIIDVLPSGCEISIGGGNPLSHPNLISFLNRTKEKGIINNLTVNQGHLGVYFDTIKYLLENELIYGLGISVISNQWKYVQELTKLTDNIVFHVIAGVNDIGVIDRIKEFKPIPKILILGYKDWGFGVNWRTEEVDNNIWKWYVNLPHMIGKCIISFDNLAIEQLNVKRFFTKDKWDMFYMGDDFVFTMYIDAVKQEFSPTSRNPMRISFSETNLLDFFKNKC